MKDSDFDTESVAVLKQDRRGRVLTTPSQRLVLLQQFEKSGLSGPQSARVAGINYQTFASWRQQKKRQTHPSVGNRSLLQAHGGFIEAVMESQFSATAPVALQVRLPSGTCVEVIHRHQLLLVAELHTLLQKPC